MTMELKRISKAISKTELHTLKNQDIPCSEVKLYWTPYYKISNAVSKIQIKYFELVHFYQGWIWEFTWTTSYLFTIFSFEYQLLLDQLFSDQTFKNQNYIMLGRDTFSQFQVWINIMNTNLSKKSIRNTSKFNKK